MSFFGWVSFLLNEYGGLFLKGAGVTLMLAIVGTFIGCIIGLIIGVIQTIPIDKNDNIIKRVILGILRLIFRIYIEVFRGTPMIVQAMVFYYGSAQMFGWDMSAILAGFIVVSINTGAYMAESVRGGLISIDKGQTEGAMAIGMTHWQTMINVILPQALRNILPQIGNNLIINIKDTSVLNIISVTELFFITKSAAGIYYRYFEAFFIASAIYLAMTLIASFLIRLWERKMDGPDNYSLVQSTNDPLADPCGVFPDNKRGAKHGK